MFVFTPGVTCLSAITNNAGIFCVNSIQSQELSMVCADGHTVSVGMRSNKLFHKGWINVLKQAVMWRNMCVSILALYLHMGSHIVCII